MTDVESPKRGMLYPVARSGGINLAGSEDQQWLDRLLTETTPDLVFIGPIYKLHDRDPNSENETKPVALFFDRIRAEHRCSLWLEGHMTHEEKGGRPIGWSGWRRWPDIGIELKKSGALKPWRPPRHETPALPRALKRASGLHKLREWPWLVETRGRDELWGRILDLCED